MLAPPSQPVHPVVRAMLAPLSCYYDDPDVVEMYVVGAGNVHLEYRDKPDQHIHDKTLTVGCIEKICKTLANFQGIPFDPINAPNLSCSLPGSHRFECLVGSSVQEGVSISIRCKHPFNATPAHFGLDDAMADYLFKATRDGKNIVVCGGMGTGKTTLLNLLVQSLPANLRVICAEDTLEIFYEKFTKGVGLISQRNAKSPGQISWPGILDHIGRSTPDRVLVGEISIKNVQAAINLLNAGVSGFMCSIHASSAELGLYRKFEQNLQVALTPMDNVKEMLSDIVDLVIQINVVFDGTKKVRRVVEVLEVKSGKNLMNEV